MVRKVIGPAAIALFWIPLAVLVLSHAPLWIKSLPHDSYIFTLIGIGTISGVLTLCRIRWSGDALAVALAAYILVIPAALAVAIFVVGFSTGLVQIGQI